MLDIDRHAVIDYVVDKSGLLSAVLPKELVDVFAERWMEFERKKKVLEEKVNKQP